MSTTVDRTVALSITLLPHQESKGAQRVRVRPGLGSVCAKDIRINVGEFFGIFLRSFSEKRMPQILSWFFKAE